MSRIIKLTIAIILAIALTAGFLYVKLKKDERSNSMGSTAQNNISQNKETEDVTKNMPNISETGDDKNITEDDIKKMPDLSSVPAKTITEDEIANMPKLK